MEEDEKTRLLKIYSEKPTDKLLNIWGEKDAGEWSEITIEVIGSILEERGAFPSAQISETPEEELYAPGGKFRFDWTVVGLLAVTFLITLLLGPVEPFYNLVPFLMWSPFLYLLMRKAAPINRAIALSLLFLACGEIHTAINEKITAGLLPQDPLSRVTLLDELSAVILGVLSFAPLLSAVVMLVKGAFREINLGEAHKNRIKNNRSARTNPSTMPKAEPLGQLTSKPTVEPKDKEPVETEKPQMSGVQGDEKFHEQVATNLEESSSSRTHDDEQFYEQVAAELSDGTIKKGLWLKAETKARGDKDAARLLYIEWRVEQLSEEEK
jgi:hypothetical protein